MTDIHAEPEDMMDAAEPILSDCMDRLVSAEISPMNAAHFMVLFGLDHLSVNACCHTHLRDRMRNVSSLIAEWCGDA